MAQGSKNSGPNSMGEQESDNSPPIGFGALLRFFGNDQNTGTEDRGRSQIEEPASKPKEKQGLQGTEDTGSKQTEGQGPQQGSQEKEKLGPHENSSEAQNLPESETVLQAIELRSSTVARTELYVSDTDIDDMSCRSTCSGGSVATSSVPKRNRKSEKTELSSISANTGARRGKPIPIRPSDFESELSEFFYEFCRILYGRRKFDSTCCLKEGTSTLMTTGPHSVTSTILKKEFSSFIDHMPDIDFFLSGKYEHGTADRATFFSFKRRLEERKNEIETLRKVLKQKEIANRDLRNRVFKYETERKAACAEAAKHSEEMERMREHVRCSETLLEQSSVENENVYFLKHSKERYIDFLVVQIEQARMERERSNLTHTMLEKRLNEANRRNEAAKKSEASITDKVAELQEIQQTLIRQVEDATRNNRGVRGALSAMNRRNREMFSRIGSIFSRSNPDAENQEFGGTQTGSCAEARNGNGHVPTGFSGSPVQSGETQSGSSSRVQATNETRTAVQGSTETRDPTCIETGNRLARSDNGSRVGAVEISRGPVRRSVQEEDDRRFLSRRTKRALFADMSALRDVIEMKEKEIERMQKAFEKESERSSQLEMAMLKNEQDIKVENQKSQKAHGVSTSFQVTDPSMSEVTKLQKESIGDISHVYTGVSTAKSKIEARFKASATPDPDEEDDDIIQPTLSRGNGIGEIHTE